MASSVANSRGEHYVLAHMVTVKQKECCGDTGRVTIFAVSIFQIPEDNCRLKKAEPVLACVQLSEFHYVMTG